MGTPARTQPRKPTPEEAFVARLEQDSGRLFLSNLANAYGIPLERVLVTVDEPFLADGVGEARPPKIHRIAPEIMQTLHQAAFELQAAFQDSPLYDFPSTTSADDILSYVINTDNHRFIQIFLQLALAESRQKGYFQPKYDQYAQNAQLIKRQKMELFQLFTTHFWDADSKTFCYRPETVGGLGSPTTGMIYL